MSNHERSAPQDLGGAPNGMRDPRSIEETVEQEFTPEEQRALMRELREYDTLPERDNE